MNSRQQHDVIYGGLQIKLPLSRIPHFASINLSAAVKIVQELCSIVGFSFELEPISLTQTDFAVFQFKWVALTKKLGHEAYFIMELSTFSHIDLSRVRQSFDAEGTVKNGAIAKNRCFFHLIRHQSDAKLSTTNGKRNKRSLVRELPRHCHLVQWLHARWPFCIEWRNQYEERDSIMINK